MMSLGSPTKQTDQRDRNFQQLETSMSTIASTLEEQGRAITSLLAKPPMPFIQGSKVESEMFKICKPLLDTPDLKSHYTQSEIWNQSEEKRVLKFKPRELMSKISISKSSAILQKVEIEKIETPSCFACKEST
jgi:hypothetical protein